ncbi:MAG TPA: hypothetical protein VD793_02110, partial [Gemmatimonadales bacterium]|nr:hypothetical protein [Gemmatimonadales bacterium]
AVIVEGEYLLPCSNYRMASEATLARDSLFVSVSYESFPTCAASVLRLRYRATIRGIPIGRYRVSVTHQLFTKSQGGVGMQQIKVAWIDVS